MARPRLHTEDVRRELLHQATTLLAAEGPSGITIRRVADAAGTSPPAVYDLIGDKTALVRELFLHGFRRLHQLFEEVPTTADPVADLLGLGLAYRASALENPHLYDVMFACPFPEFRPTDADLTESMQTFSQLVERVRTAIGAGAIANGDPLDVALVLFAQAHGLASLELKGWLGQPAEADQRWQLSLAAMLAGMRAPAGPNE